MHFSTFFSTYHPISDRWERTRGQQKKEKKNKNHLRLSTFFLSRLLLFLQFLSLSIKTIIAIHPPLLSLSFSFSSLVLLSLFLQWCVCCSSPHRKKERSSNFLLLSFLSSSLTLVSEVMEIEGKVHRQVHKREGRRAKLDSGLPFFSSYVKEMNCRSSYLFLSTSPSSGKWKKQIGR